MKRAFWLALLAGPALVGTAWAQPAPPSAPTAPAAPRNIWSFFSKTPEQSAQCQDKFCKSILGKMVSSSMGPLSAFSGGLIENRCASKAIDDILKDKSKEGSAEGVAAQIKKEEAEAKARREAVRFLGTVDCDRFPEAKGVLIKSLLDDSNECVRYEAALALQSGCCCNKETVKALTDVITGKGRIPETSERVKAAAAVALSTCEVAVTAPSTIEDKKKIEDQKKVELSPSEYYKRIRQIPQAEIMDEARQALAEYRAKQPAAGNTSAPDGPPRLNSVAAILSNAFSPSARATSPGPVETAAQTAENPPMDSKVVNAIPASRSEAAAPPPPAVTTPLAPSAPVERRPFFENLTRALKGKQTSRMSGIPAELLAAPDAPVLAPASTTAPDTAIPRVVDADMSNSAAPRPLPVNIRPAFGAPGAATPRSTPMAPVAPQQP